MSLERPTGCQHPQKRHFPTEQAAVVRLLAIQAAPQTETIPIRPYQCRCGQWCLSSRRAGTVPKGMAP